MDSSAKYSVFQTKKPLPKWMLDEVASIVEQVQKDAEIRIDLAQAELLRAQVQAKGFQIHIEKLSLELLYLRRMRFGAKTEHYSVEQSDLFKEDFSADIAAIEAELAKKTAAAQAEKDAQPKVPRVRAGRQPLPDHLPRIDFPHEPASCDCAQCGKVLIKIGADITEN